MTTPAKRFGDWLKAAMRRAGLDVDTQMGGGRAALADAVGVSRSTVKRWLDGDSLPEATKFEAISRTLGVPVPAMLVESGLVSVKAIGMTPQPEPRAETALEALGVTSPADQELILGMIRRLQQRDELRGEVERLSEEIRGRLAARPKFTEPSEE